MSTDPVVAAAVAVLAVVLLPAWLAARTYWPPLDDGPTPDPLTTDTRHASPTEPETLT